MKSGRGRIISGVMMGLRDFSYILGLGQKRTLKKILSETQFYGVAMGPLGSENYEAGNRSK